MNAATAPAAAWRATLQRALVVDDDPFMQAVLADMLRDLGLCEVASAADGTAALALISRSKAPDLIVCDLFMPGCDGFQFMEKLGATRFAGAVVLVSGLDGRTRSSAALMGRFHQLDIVATLDKPVDAFALRRALADRL